MKENIYYTILDACYLAKYMSLESQNIDTIIENIETLLTEMKAWKDANLKVINRQANDGSSQGFIFYTVEKEVADRVFKSGYFTTKSEYLLTPTVDVLEKDDTLERDRIRMNSTLNTIFKAIASSDFEKERLLAEPEADLTDTLLSDLNDIGLSTIEKEAIQEDEIEELPDELFDDLIDEDQGLDKKD